MKGTRVWTPDDDAGHVFLSCNLNQRFGDVGAFDPQHLRAQVFGEAQVVFKLATLLGASALPRRCLYEDGEESGL